MNKEKFKDLNYKVKLLLQKVRHFNLTLYLLNRNEQKLLKSVELKEGTIEFYRERIIAMTSQTLEFEEAIKKEEENIKTLNADIRKIRKVINLKIK